LAGKRSNAGGRQRIMESNGERLKKIRLEKGITLEEVHKKTKIHLDIIKAIEDDSLINLSPVYTKGFLKIYCKFLGIDPKDCMPDYKEPQGIVSSLSVTSERPTSLLKKVSLKLISIRSVPLKIKKILILVLLIILVIGLYNLGRIISSKRKFASKKAKTPIIATTVTEQSKQPTAKSQKTATAISAVIRLSILAKDNCWVQLKADGRVIFQNILRKGRTETWEAKDKIELALGNAGGVDLEINGKFIPSLGRKGQVLKNIFITKEGLRIGR
jgi:cytoskeletal protein RodZ